MRCLVETVERGKETFRRLDISFQNRKRITVCRTDTHSVECVRVIVEEAIGALFVQDVQFRKEFLATFVIDLSAAAKRFRKRMFACNTVDRRINFVHGLQIFGHIFVFNGMKPRFLQTLDEILGVFGKFPIGAVFAHFRKFRKIHFGFDKHFEMLFVIFEAGIEPLIRVIENVEIFFRYTVEIFIVYAVGKIHRNIR